VPHEPRSRSSSREPGGGSAGLGQAEGADPAEDPPGVLAEPDPPVPGELPAGFQVGQVMQERLDVGAAEGGGMLTVVVAGGVQVRRQPGDRRDDVPEPGVRTLPPVLGQLIAGPSLDRFPQPVLGDTGEGQPPRRSEHDQVPLVLGCLAGRVAGRGTHVAGQ